MYISIYMIFSKCLATLQQLQRVPLQRVQLLQLLQLDQQLNKQLDNQQHKQHKQRWIIQQHKQRTSSSTSSEKIKKIILKRDSHTMFATTNPRVYWGNGVGVSTKLPESHMCAKRTKNIKNLQFLKVGTRSRLFHVIVLMCSKRE